MSNLHNFLYVIGTANAVVFAASAATLPPPSTLAHCAVNSTFVDDPTACLLGNSDVASASLTLSPVIGLTAEAFSPAAPGLHGAGATAIVHYSFEVIGGAVGDLVPLLIATTLS